MRRTLATLTQLFLTLAILGAAVYVYYRSPLRDRVESRLYDVRSRLAPTFKPVSDVALVTIDEDDIAQLEGGGAKDLGYHGLDKLLAELRKSEARAIVVLLHAQVFPYDDNGLSGIAGVAAQDDRIVLGAFNLAAGEKGGGALPRTLRTVVDRVGDAGIFRWFRRDVVRNYVLEEPGHFPFLAARVLERIGASEQMQAVPRNEKGARAIHLSYVGPQAIPSVSATAVTRGEGRDTLRGRIVVVGYKAFRPWTAFLLDATHVNSPWQSDGADVDGNAMSVATVHAVALSNLLKGTWLREASLATNVLQCVAIVAATLAFWRFSVGFACFLFIGGWSLYIIAHSALFAFGSTYLPLADALLVSVIALIVGGIFKLRLEGRHRAAAEAEAASQAEVARVQNRFLDRLTKELIGVNLQVKDLISYELPAEAAPSLRAAHGRVGAGCDELSEYLVGMEQLSSINAETARKIKLAPVPLGEALKSLLTQFEARADEAKVELLLECEPDVTALADAYLLRQIAYNLVSNAVKYSPQGGVVRIVVKRAEGVVELAVIDSGPGIGAEFHDKIFEKFYRVKDDLVYKVRGHGLGLYLCKFFADQIGATVAVSSTLGQGSTFTLRLRAKGQNGP